MHHKRGRPKNRRAGCLMCKPHKMNHAKKKAWRLPVIQKALDDAKEQLDAIV